MDYAAQVLVEMRTSGCDHREACKRVAKRDPRAHRTFLLATNSPRVHHLIRDRFAQESERKNVR